MAKRKDPDSLGCTSKLVKLVLAFLVFTWAIGALLRDDPEPDPAATVEPNIVIEDRTPEPTPETRRKKRKSGGYPDPSSTRNAALRPSYAVIPVVFLDPVPTLMDW